MKTLCNRGAAIISIHLTEPVLYLAGFEASEYTDRSPAMLRGSLILKLLKPSKIKSITLVFKGRARTEWPEGIPPRKAEFFEEKELMTHTWPFFNAQFSSSDSSHGADAARFLDSQRLSMDLSRSSMDSVSSLALSDAPTSRSATPVGSPNLLALNSANSHFGIPFGQSRSFSKEDKTVTQSRGYRTFAAGEYVYNFELPLDSVLPESIEADMGSVHYELEATVERSGAFKSNLSGKTEVLLVRNPAEQNLEIHEPISISRTWYSLLNTAANIVGKINCITRF
jgi:arrestin-related trafficking adapter 3/6